MQNNITTGNLSPEHQMISLYNEHQSLITDGNPQQIIDLREKALRHLEKQGFPNLKTEEWRFTDVEPLFDIPYEFDFTNQSRPFDIDSIFTCDVYDLDTFSVTLLNGWFVYKNAPLTSLKDGTVIGSLSKAIEVYPDLVLKYLGNIAKIDQPGFTALNTAFFQDGLFIYVPEGVEVEKPIQLINIINSEKPVLTQPRHLIIQEKKSKMTLVHCDHSLTNKISLTNSLLEAYQDTESQMEYYKVQNKGPNSGVISHSFFNLKYKSQLNSSVLTLNGGFTRNQVNVRLEETLSNAVLNGLYLVDGNQHVDNQIEVDHAAENCESEQLYKGILDDEATAVFSGKIMVRKDAQQTMAYQNNKNLLLSDDAKANAQPQLEIYADDVKCSHGATVGQLDPEAMFYLRSRGMDISVGRQLLMYAYAAEVVKRISIEPLRERIDHLVEKRLKGELSICDQCVLHCNSKEPAVFNIDMSKI